MLGRVFLATPLPDEIRFAVAERISEIPIPGRVAPPENWHVTLRFLDVVDRVTYERFLSGLDPLVETSFPLRLSGFGAFPNPRRATVFWAGIGVGTAQLGMLNEQAEEAAVGAGLLPEERPFHAHMTLSRIRPHGDVRGIVGEQLDLGWRCERLVTYRTHVGRGGVRYEPLDVLDLVG